MWEKEVDELLASYGPSSSKGRGGGNTVEKPKRRMRQASGRRGGLIRKVAVLKSQSLVGKRNKNGDPAVEICDVTLKRDARSKRAVQSCSGCIETQRNQRTLVVWVVGKIIGKN